MSHVTSRERRRVLPQQAATLVDDLPAVAAVHCLLVRLAIRRLTERLFLPQLAQIMTGRGPHDESAA